MDISFGSFCLFWGLPLLLNCYLAQKEGRNVLFICLLTIPLSWMLTSFLACNMLIDSPVFSAIEQRESEIILSQEIVRKDGLGLICSTTTQAVEIYAPRQRNARICPECQRRNRKTDEKCFVCGAIL